MIVPLLTLESQIKRRLRAHLRKLGYTKNSAGLLTLPGTGKNTVRLLHQDQRIEKLRAEGAFVKENLPALLSYFASGADVEPAKISPRLQLVEANTTESDLFRLACLTWTVPVSQGYGRRMRFLIWDDNNGKLIGLIALGDPVFNLKARDVLIGWNQAQRRSRLVNVMDAYVLGALPPYNMLLGGKLVASLVRTKEVRDLFRKKYAATKGIISGKQKRAALTIITTSSALGRSSIYNRLKLDGIKYFESIGYTTGYGHFHIPDSLFQDMRTYLKRKHHRYANNHDFGDGPNWKLRTVRLALDLIGMNSELLKHNISREVFLCRIASNAERVLLGKAKRRHFKKLLSVKEVSELAINRWILPRAISRPEFRQWQRSDLQNLLVPSAADATLSSDRSTKCSQVGEGRCSVL